MIEALHHPKKARRDNWCTPEKILIPTRKVFHGRIGLDPCSNAESIVNARVEYRLPDRDGLVLPWTARTIFVNPPFGQGIGRWMKRCLEASRVTGAEVIALLPATPDTKAWRECVESATCVCFVYGRITFLGATSVAPCPSAIVYWGQNWVGFARAFRPLGGIWRYAGVDRIGMFMK